MDRDAFPQLLEGSTGWPMMRVPWGRGNCVDVEVSEDNEIGSVPVVSVFSSTDRVRLFVNSREVQL